MPDNRTGIPATQPSEARQSTAEKPSSPAAPLKATPAAPQKEECKVQAVTSPKGGSAAAPAHADAGNKTLPASPKEPTPAAAGSDKAAPQSPTSPAVPAKAASATPKTDGGSKPAVPPTLPASAERSTPSVIPDLVLTARPVVTTLGNLRSRLSPAMKAVLLVVLLPTFLSLLYFGLWASPMYIAEARFAVRGAETGGGASGLAALLLSSGASVGADAHIVAEYIQSPDIMEAIDREMHIFSHFSSREYDLISRLTAEATRDERLSYWQWAVKPSFDPETGIIALSVKAYDPVTAQKLTEAVLARSEALVNAMSREKVLKQYLDTVKKEYDYILLDCMPSLGMLTVNTLAAADGVIIPVQAQYLSAKGLEQLLQTVQKVRRQINPKLKIEGILLTMTDSRTNYGQQIDNLIRGAYGSKIKVFDQTIPRSVRAAEISAVGKSIFQHDPKGKVAEAYQSLTKEVLADAEKQLKRVAERGR